MRVAIVHPWFLAMGGAEQTVSVLADMFPDADIFALFSDEKQLPPNLKKRKIISSSFNWLPAKYKLYRHLLPFYPTGFESLDLRGYDLIVSSDSCIAKGIQIDQGAVHICYCHSPMRCLYDQYFEYLSELPLIAKPIFIASCHYLRMWDYVSAQRVTSFAANSRNIAQRIETYYQRESTVIYPPVDTGKGYIDSNIGDYYLTVGRLTSTKRVDLLVQACNQLGRRLVIVGSGRESANLKKIAGKTIEFKGHVSVDELSTLYAQCRAFLFAADEDFGIVPVEAQSYGRPVIAYGHGGSLETVIEFETGFYFKQQSAESVVGAIVGFESMENRFSSQIIQQHAGKFDVSVFKKKLLELVNDVLSRKSGSPAVVQSARQTLAAV